MRKLRGRISRGDVVIAAIVAVALQVEAQAEHLTPRGIAISAFALLGALLLLRRVAPLPVLVAGLATQLIAVAAGLSSHTPVTPLLFFVLVLYSVGLVEERVRAVGGLALALGLVLATLFVAKHNGEAFDGTDIPFVALVCSTPWFVGRAMRGRLRQVETLERRAGQLEAERLAAVTEERARIARELHDVIAHSVSVMVVQAAAAEQVLKLDPERAVDPLRSVQETGRQALVEMSRLLGLLRADSEELGFAPQPRLDELDALLAQVRGAGLPVELRVQGERRALPPALELTAYRVVQEALTNTLKHGGEAHAEVRLGYTLDAFELEVVDDGPGSDDGHVGGHGLAGMRERVNVFGGDFAAGPRPDGGFAVRVRLPVEAEPA
jgi:signal transduction histidine kinase